ncbi:MAG: DUF6364 family protein [Chitinophagales bacterium]|nr:DUF6364 family protein [Chitinophagales bacterium]
MKTKLTLTIDAKKIMKARRLARKQKTSISNLIEKYLDSVSEKQGANWADKWTGIGDLNAVLKKGAKDQRIARIAKKQLK